MINRLRTIGVVIGLIGLAFVVAGAFAFIKVQDGQRSLTAFSAAQNVQLTYNDEGQLVDRGETAGAAAIMALLTDDWGFSVVDSELDPNDPVVNTATEYMYQMATIAYHVLNGTQTVTLTEDVEYNGETFKAGTYEVPIEGRYYSEFDRAHPLYGPARGLAWSATALGLIGQLGVGSITASTLQLGLAIAGLLAGLGATFLFVGGGLVWATRAEVQKAPVAELKPAATVA